VAFVEFTPSGGLFQFSAQLGEALAAGGDEVHLLTGADPELAPAHPDFHIRSVLRSWHPADQEVVHPVARKVRRAGRAGLRLFSWFQVLWHLRRLRPDVVIWSSWRFSMDALGVLAVDRLLPRAALTIVAHEPRLRRRGDTIAERRGLVLDRALAGAWRAMDVVFVLGAEARAKVLECWEPSGPVVVIPHGDEAALRGSEPVPAVGSTAPVVLFFGGWTAYKGIDVLLDAVLAVRQEVPDARFVVAGAVAGVDLPALQARAAELGVETRPGYVPKDQVATLFGAARVVAIPYRRATQSGVVHLAYTFERPVVATAVGDIPAVVEDGETGILVPPEDPDALARGLVTLLTDADRAERMGVAGAKWLATESSWAQVAAAVHGAVDVPSSAR
jgi:glycosyltransferase involved in cell wall biosynthesis